MDSTTVSTVVHLPDAELHEGYVCGRYVIEAKLGSGGMGEVYAARDPHLDRSVAIKVLRRTPGFDPDQAVLQMLREGAAMATLTHPNVVAVFDVGRVEGRAWLAMELVEGQTLRSWLNSGPTLPEILCAFAGVGAGLAAAHGAGLVHRDVKLTNIMIDRQGRPRVLDFGVSTARLAGAMPGAASTMSRSRLFEGETAAHGVRVGTPLYMAPEQFRGESVDHRADQFSFCVALHVALKGVYPTLVQRQVATAPGRHYDAQLQVPRAVEEAMRRGLAEAADDRWPHMHALLDAMRRSTRRRVRGPAVVAVATGLALGLTWDSLGATAARCGGAAEQLATAWSPGHAAALAARVAQSPKDGAWPRAAERLDRWQRQWLAARRDACPSETLDDAQWRAMDRTIACLDRKLAPLGSIGAKIEDGTLEGGRALGAVLGLAPPDACTRDRPAGEAAPPEDPEVERRVAEIRAELSGIDGLVAVGAYADAYAQAIHWVPLAEGIGYAPLVAETQALLGVAAKRVGKLDEAKHALEQAFLIGSASGHDMLALQAATDLIYVVGVEAGDMDGGRAWLRDAQAALDRIGGKPVQAAKLALNRGQFQYAAGDYDLAAASMEVAIAAYKTFDDGPMLASAHNTLGVLRTRQGLLDDARVAFGDALAIYESVYGEKSAQVGAALANLGAAHRRGGNVKQAIAALERSLAIQEEVLGADHPDVYAPLVNLGNMASDQGRHADAIGYLERAVAVLEAAGEHRRQAAEAKAAYATALLAADRPVDAVAAFRSAVDGFELTLGPKHQYTLHTATGLGAALVDVGRLEEAREVLEPVVQGFAALADTTHEHAEARFALARAIVDEEPERARQLAGEAIAAFEASEVKSDGLRLAKRWLAEHAP